MHRLAPEKEASPLFLIYRRLFFHGRPLPPLLLLRRSFSPSPDHDPVPGILAALRRCATARGAKQVHARLVMACFPGENSLLFRLVELRDRAYASSLFSRLSRPDSFAFNVMIRGSATAWADYPAALDLHRRLLRSGERPDRYTFPFVLAAAGHLLWPLHGGAVHSSTFKSGHQSDAHTQHSLITMYARCGRILCARQVFDELLVRDSVSWNSLISGYSRLGLAGDAVEAFRRMTASGLEPDDMTLVSAAAACGDLGDLALGQRLEGLAAARGADLNSFLGCALVSMYGRCGDLDAARRVFDGMSSKHLITWNAMISGYSQNGLAREAIAVFKLMQEAGTEPNEVTMVTVLSACAAAGDVALGQWVDAVACERKLAGDVYVGTALVDMHAKCGNLCRAVQVFEGMRDRNVVSWNAMISALALHGRAGEALELFARMREARAARPNDITFVAVLTACVHAGLVAEGRRWFGEMAAAFGVAPQMEHYACMVDLLARAGRVEEAWEFMAAMPEKPDAVVLGALLAACRTCKNVLVGERVVRRLLELEPGNSGNYVISSKMYAGCRRWEESARIRGLMRERGVAKTPGCSWIQVAGQAHEFRSGDALHPDSVELHRVLLALFKEMKLHGYAPDPNLP
ncbi:pentatricopeptide repeat (PPR-like) superfamily protein [Wolffia australiana]